MACVINYNNKTYSLEDFKNILLQDPFLIKKVANKSQERLKVIQEVFNSNPELSKVGNVFSYAIYLDTVFPESKVKDIVYRGGGEELVPAIDSTFGSGYYFTPAYKLAEMFADIAEARDRGYRLDTAILNLEKPKYFIEGGVYDFKNTKKEGFDGVSVKTTEKYKGNSFEGVNEYVVFEPEQIHILSSKADIQGFKDFMSFENSEFSKYGTYQQFRDFITSKSSIEIENKLIETGKIDRAC